MNEVELRAIAESERAELLAAARRYWLGLMPHWPGNHDPARQAAYFAERFQTAASTMGLWWAIVDGARVGFARVDFHDDLDGRWAQVGDFYIEPEHRRQGHGRRTALAMVDQLKAQGFHRIDLNVRQDNPTALAFWRSVGFELALYRMRLHVG